jgi:hypothetical protein
LNSSNSSWVAKKAEEYFQGLSKVEQDKLIEQFKKEKLKTLFLRERFENDYSNNGVLKSIFFSNLFNKTKLIK